MECLAAEHVSDTASLPAVLKIRDPASQSPAWSDPVMLLSGVHAAGMHPGRLPDTDRLNVTYWPCSTWCSGRIRHTVAFNSVAHQVCFVTVEGA
jgi:hypothetical protein